MPKRVDEAYTAMCHADYLIIVGTSLPIGYTLEMFKNLKHETKVYYLDPEPVMYLDSYGLDIRYIKKNASEGMRDIIENIMLEIEVSLKINNN